MCKVSVVIPNYNTELYIEETIKSVLNQSLQDIELIVVDDGSTDKSIEILESIKDVRLKVLKQKNAGVSVARNNGFSHSKGTYVAFLDSDDVWTKDCLSQKVSAFEENNELGLVHGDMQVIDGSSNKKEQVLSGISGWILDDLLAWKQTCIPSPSSILVRREIVDKVGGFDPSFSTAADQEFFIRVAKEFEIKRVAKVLGYYRVHGNNMHSNISVMEKDHIGVFFKAKNLGLFKNKQFERLCFANLYKIIGASYIKNSTNKLRGVYFLLRSLLKDPLVLMR